jgi:hypothetical protein
MNNLQNALGLLRDFPSAFDEVQTGFLPFNYTFQLKSGETFLSDSPFLEDWSKIEMDFEESTAPFEESNSFYSSSLRHWMDVQVEWRAFPADYFNNLSKLWFWNKKFVFDGDTRPIFTIGIEKKKVEEFLKRHAMHRHGREGIKNAFENFLKVPDLAELQTFYHSGAPGHGGGPENVSTGTKLETKQNELSELAITWMKMRFQQIRVASLFSDELTTVCRGILESFQKRTTPAHPFIAIIETQIRLLVLFANNKFQRAFQLARQTGDALKDFYDGVSSRPPKTKIIRREEGDKLRRKFFMLSALSPDTLLSGLFPLTKTTALDTFFGFTEYIPGLGPVKYHGGVSDEQDLPYFYNPLYPTPRYFYNPLYSTPRRGIVSRLHLLTEMYRKGLQNLMILDGTSSPENRAIFLEEFEEALHGILRVEGLARTEKRRRIS